MAEQKGQSAAERVKALVEEAEKLRAEAARDAGAVREAVNRLAERAEQLDRRLDELAGGVREAIAELKDEVQVLREAAAVVDAPAAAEDPATRVEPDADDDLIAEAEAMSARAPDVEVGEADDVPAPGADPEEEDVLTVGEDPDVEVAAAPEGARLLALKMALDGRPREETAGYLHENFELEDPEALLDEVYARAGR
jgi:hypothetical protein